MADGQTGLLPAGTRLRFATKGGELAGMLHRPAGPARAALVLNGATGVPMGYYNRFARWLAQTQDIACLTYDYRDFGQSKSGRLRDSTVTMADWALHDQPAARDEMRRQMPDTPLWVMGHSLGGMMMPLQEGIEDVKRMICVASGLVHHGDHPWPYQALARMFWFGHVPLAVRALGYLPGRLTGFGADLPPQVYWQWRRWCTRRDSYLPETGKTLPEPDWSRCGAFVDLTALDDDPVIPAKCVTRLGSVYGAQYLRSRVLVPSDHGLDKVGHLGAFAQANSALWPHLIADHTVASHT